MTSRVNWLLLGSIIERRSYGLELAHRTQRNSAGALSISESHIYAALDRLLERGYIEAVAGRETARQPKLIYKATALGTAHYEDWVVAQTTDQLRNLELWARQLGVFADQPGAALRLLDRIEKEYQGQSRGVPDPGPSTLVTELAAEQRRLLDGVMLEFFAFTRVRFEGDG